MASRTHLAPDAADATPRPYSVLTEPFDDMHDDPREPSSPLPVHSCDDIIARFDVADREARKFRRYYRDLASWAAFLGMLAVILAIVELHWELHWSVNVGEFAAAAAAVLCWVFMFQHKYGWLAQRHQAERYRQAKFKLLLSTDDWAAPNRTASEDWISPSWLTGELGKIAGLHTKKSLKGVINRPALHGPFEISGKKLHRKTVRQIVEYYLTRRLNPQMAYLANRAQINELLDFLLLLLAYLFSISVVAAAVHAFVAVFLLPHARAGLTVTGPQHPVRVAVEISALMLAACLPVMATLVRTLRAAFEFSRNKSRFSAAQGALFDLQYGLIHAGLTSLPVASFPGSTTHAPVVEIDRSFPLQPGGSMSSDEDWIDAEKVLQELHWCEHILATEHIEWLRLMMETELFG